VPALTPTVNGYRKCLQCYSSVAAGLTLDTTSGAISGTPTAATPNTSYVVKATNSGRLHDGHAEVRSRICRRSV